MQPCRCAVSAVDGGTRGNIIPDKLRFCGDFHWVNPADGERFPRELEQIVTGVCAGYGCQPQVHAP